MKGISSNNGLDDLYCGVVLYKVDSLTLTSINCLSPTLPYFPTLDTTISDTSASGIYLSADATHSNHNPYYPYIIVVTATAHIQKSSAICRTLPTHLPDHLSKGHIFPIFSNSLVGISPF